MGNVIDGKNKSVTNKLRIVRELTREEFFKEMASCAGVSLEPNPFPADEVIRAREHGTLDKLLPSGTEFPVQFSNGEWNVLVVCRDRGHTYLVMKYLMAKLFAMNGDLTSKGGWPACRMRKHVLNVYDMLPEDIRKTVIPMHIKQLRPAQAVECDDKAFLLSATNVFGTNTWDPLVDYADTQIDIFRYPTARIKERLGASSASWWWLRSASGNYYFNSVSSDGSNDDYGATTEGGVVVGFCIESRS